MQQATETSPRLIYSFGPFLLDPAERRLVRDDRDLRLPPKVFETLVLLVERHGLLVEKDDLMAAVWPGTFVEEVALARNISLLRKTLGDAPGPDQSQYIETVSKRGYRFIAPVTELPPPPRQAAEPRQIDPASLAPPRRWWQSRARIALAGLALLFIVTAAFLQFRALRTEKIHSLAVLPLENLSGDPNQEYFADGMTDELITNLAQIRSLRVISRTSVMQFKHTKKTLPEIAKELNVDGIVEGSVSRQGNDVHITAQLLNARPERHLWAASYERQITDVLGLQSQVAKAIADQIKASLTPQEDAHLTKVRQSNPEAYDALLKGRFLRSKRMANTSQALPYFQQAVAVDPNNAEAWEALADSYADLGADLGGDPAVLGPQARAALAKAFELDPDLAEAHATAGWIKLWYDWDAAGAEREFRRAIELSPNNSVVHRRYSHYFRMLGRFDDALEEDRRAIDLSPLDMLPQAHLAWIYADARLGDKTIQQSKRLIEMDPNFINGYGWLGRGYELKQQWPEAIEAYKHFGKEGCLPCIAHVWAATGKKQQAEAVTAQFLEASRHQYISPLYFAKQYAHLGYRDKAFEWLDKAYRERAAGMLGIGIDADFDNLRSDPRFQDLERRVGL